MIRTQISLTEAQLRRLRREAARRGVSMAELVRQAVDQVVPDELEERRQLRLRALRAAGIYSSGAGDIAERHDDYLAELDRW